MKKSVDRTFLTEQTQVLSKASEILRFTTKPNFIPDWTIKSKIIKSLIALITILRKRMNNKNQIDSRHHLQNVKATVAGLHSHFIICREMGYLSESDFLDLTDKLIRLTS